MLQIKTYMSSLGQPNCPLLLKYQPPTFARIRSNLTTLPGNSSAGSESSAENAIISFKLLGETASDWCNSWSFNGTKSLVKPSCTSRQSENTARIILYCWQRLLMHCMVLYDYACYQRYIVIWLRYHAYILIVTHVTYISILQLSLLTGHWMVYDFRASCFLYKLM